MVRVLGWATAAGLSLALPLAPSSAFAQAPPTATSFPADPAPTPAPAPAPTPTPAPPPAATAPNPVAEPLPPTVAPPPAMSAEPPLNAADEPVPPAQRENLGPFLSLTFSPLHLLSPVFELQIEARVVPHFGAALIAGVGSIKSERTPSGVPAQNFSAYELGAQVVGYPLQPFESLQLGAELLWIKVSTENFNGQQITADAGGVAVGPFVGYKLVTRAGFTFFAQGGFEYLVARADASDNLGNTASDERSAFIPLLNLNVGWTF